MYSVHLAFTPVNNQLYSYKKANRWVSVRQSNKRFIPREYQHPDGIKMGEHWMEKPVSFKMVKITNDQNASNREHLVLNSMQKYHPTVKIVCCLAETSHTITHVYHLTEMSFFAVTSYQNRKVYTFYMQSASYNTYFLIRLLNSKSLTIHMLVEHFKK